MNRKKQALKVLKSYPKNFVQIDLNTAREVPKWCTRAFVNNRYFVTIDDNAKTSLGLGIKAMVQNHFNTPIVGHWSELQKIKNEIFGEETIAIEYYPKESHLVNDKNIYWLWIFEENIIPIPYF